MIVWWFLFCILLPIPISQKYFCKNILILSLDLYRRFTKLYFVCYIYNWISKSILWICKHSSDFIVTILLGKKSFCMDVLSSREKTKEHIRQIDDLINSLVKRAIRRVSKEQIFAPSSSVLLLISKHFITFTLRFF